MVDNSELQIQNLRASTLEFVDLNTLNILHRQTARISELRHTKEQNEKKRFQEIKTQWFKIITEGDSKAALEFLTIHKGININEKDPFSRRSPLKEANSNFELTKILLEHNADPSIKDNYLFWNVHFQICAPYQLPHSQDILNRIQTGRSILDLLLCYDYKPSEEEIDDVFTSTSPVPSVTMVIPKQMPTHLTHGLKSMSNLLKAIPILGGISRAFDYTINKIQFPGRSYELNSAYPPHTMEGLKSKLNELYEEIRNEKNTILTRYSSAIGLQKKIPEDCALLVFQFVLDKKLNKEVAERRRREGRCVSL